MMGKTTYLKGLAYAVAAVVIIMSVVVHVRVGTEGVDMEKDTTPERYGIATFAGGCFWCMEPPFENLDGVVDVVPGYTGGMAERPTYEDVSSGGTGHVEAIRVVFDPAKVSYDELLDVFWKQIDPTDTGGQFADRGSQYRTAIFYHDDHQKLAAERSRERLEVSGKFDRPIVTEIVPASEFYEAETYHRDYYRKNPVRYELYKKASGRSDYIENTWTGDGGGDTVSKPPAEKREVYTCPGPEQLRRDLTPMQYKVTQEEGTERPFNNAYWDNKEEGIYVDVVSGEPLFSSTDKYVSGSGWPSFTKPIDRTRIVEKEDTKLALPRTEVRSSAADSHLGHVFPDGPGPEGTRYCINSAALRFIPKDRMDEEGYGEYLYLFEDDEGGHMDRERSRS